MKQCHELFDATGNGMFICTSGVQKAKLECEFCRRVVGSNMCDYPVGGKCPKCKGQGAKKPDDKYRLLEEALTNIIAGCEKPMMSVDQARADLITLQKSLVCPWCVGSGRAMCNRRFCPDCGVVISTDEGYCKDHAARAGKTAPVIKERCFWIDESKYDGKCLRASCHTEVAVGERVLYFPERRRVMDAECGEAYLRIAVERTA